MNTWTRKQLHIKVEEYLGDKHKWTLEKLTVWILDLLAFNFVGLILEAKRCR